MNRESVPRASPRRAGFWQAGRRLEMGANGPIGRAGYAQVVDSSVNARSKRSPIEGIRRANRGVFGLGKEFLWTRPPENECSTQFPPKRNRGDVK